MRIATEHVHHSWDNSLAPVQAVASGGRIDVAMVDASGGQLTSASVAADVPALDFSHVNPVTGPIEIVGAAPGDAVAVRILELEVGEWGWAAVIPGFGLLADEFPEPELVHARTADGRVSLPFGPILPALPMIGTLGLALPLAGAHPLLPPSRFGGNMDTRHVTAGATVYLPVGVDRASTCRPRPGTQPATSLTRSCDAAA